MKRKIIPVPIIEIKILELCTIIMVIESIIMLAVLVIGECNIAKLEKDYQATVWEERIPVKEQARLYIDALEFPKEDVAEEETQIDETDTEEQRTLALYYNPTEEERHWAYLMAKAEAGTEDSFGMTLETNVAINRAIEKGKSLVEVFIEKGQYSSIHNGVPHLRLEHEDGSVEWILVTEDMITDEIREAVDKAFEKDYTEEMLKEEAISKGLDSSYYEGGALFFYNPKGVLQKELDIRANVQVSFQHKNHVFYRVWEK